jgi:phosphoribosylglycinamide formyltransferase-1
LLKVGFLASKNGSSFRAILGAMEAGELNGEARLLVSNRAAAPALDYAQSHGVPTLVIPTLPDEAAADAELARALGEAGVDLVVLSGYLRKLGPRTLEAFRGRVLNIHPALLPKFGGHGMYGRRVHEAVAAAGDRISGCSVHIVDGEYDRGPLLATREARLAPGDDAEAIERKVTALEPALFVEVLQRIDRGDLKLS